MKRATCVGHSTLPRAQTRWLGAPFEAPWLANQAAANSATCFRRRSKRWGPNPTKITSRPKMARAQQTWRGPVTRPIPLSSEQGARRKRFSADRMARRSTCFHGNCTMKHRGDTRFAHIHIPELPTCSQIACCIDVAKVDVNKALCVRIHVHCMRAPGPRVFIVRA